MKIDLYLGFCPCIVVTEGLDEEIQFVWVAHDEIAHPLFFFKCSHIECGWKRAAETCNFLFFCEPTWFLD